MCVEQNVAGSNLALCFDFFFSLVKIFLSSCEPFQHGASIACCKGYTLYGTLALKHEGMKQPEG